MAIILNCIIASVFDTFGFPYDNLTVTMIKTHVINTQKRELNKNGITLPPIQVVIGV